jgi:hypothetical protein
MVDVTANMAYSLGILSLDKPVVRLTQYPPEFFQFDITLTYGVFKNLLGDICIHDWLRK